MKSVIIIWIQVIDSNKKDLVNLFFYKRNEEYTGPLKKFGRSIALNGTEMLSKKWATW